MKDENKVNLEIALYLRDMLSPRRLFLHNGEGSRECETVMSMRGDDYRGSKFSMSKVL
jgi:hypothetical protein